MKPLAHVLFALGLAAVQASLLRWAGGGWFSLSLLAACVVYLGLNGGNVDGSVAAAGVGYVMDLMAGSPKGLMTFLAVLLFLVVRAVSAAVDVRGRAAFALLAPCVVYLGLNGGNVDGSVATAGVGYVMDLMAGTPKGLMTFLAVALFLAVRAVSAAIDVRGRAAFALLSGLGAIFLSLGALILTRYTAAAEAAPGAILLPRMLAEGIVTGALSPLVSMGLRRLDGLFHREEPGLLR